MSDLNLVMRSYQVSRPTYRQFKAMAHRRGQTVSAMLRMLIEDFVRKTNQDSASKS